MTIASANANMHKEKNMKARLNMADRELGSSTGEGPMSRLVVDHY